MITSANMQSRNLIHQFENHPNIEALQENLQEKRAFNPFSHKSKEMIYIVGNMEYFEICEITPNIQCPNCMTYWSKGIVYCTCGTCSRPQDKVRKLNSDRCDVPSVPKCVIEKGDRPTGDATGTRKDRESTIKPMSLPSKRRKRGTNRDKIDS